MINRMRESLAYRISVWMVAVLLILLVLLIGGAHWITTNFYQNHLYEEVEARLSAHADLLQMEESGQIYQYLNRLETGKQSQLMITDADINPVFINDETNRDMVSEYASFIESNREEVSSSHQISFIDKVDTAFIFHIPHVWGTAPIVNERGETTGYVFIDQDTVEVNSARVSLLALLASMAILALFAGFVLTRYLTIRISEPLNEMSNRTEDIAKGDFDITIETHGEDEVGKLGEHIQHMTRQLKEYRDTRQQFISHVSHDLRTPITYIKGYSALMKDAETIETEDSRRHLQVIYDEAIRMEYLVGDLFLLTKLEEGKIRLTEDRVDLSAWLDALMKSRAIMFDQKDIQSSVHLSDALKGKMVIFDDFRMARAMVNVIENAIRHTPAGGMIRMFCEPEDDQLTFRLQDTGEGMDETEQEQIWNWFYKTDPARTRDESGTGLGLAIVKEIVTAHGGQVSLESEKGKGSVFILQIPLKWAE